MRKIRFALQHECLPDNAAIRLISSTLNTPHRKNDTKALKKLPMERIFTYIAAFLSRFVFCFHACLLIWWVTQVKRDTTYWWFLVILFVLVWETAVTVFHRRGHEYYWYVMFPSFFLNPALTRLAVDRSLCM